MSLPKQNNHKSASIANITGGDTGRYKLVKEIDELTIIPELETFFASAIKDAKLKYRELISQFINLESKVSQGFEIEKKKSYFFEANRIDFPGGDGYRWKLEKCKLNAGNALGHSIFSYFLKSLDKIEIAPNRVQTETIDLPDIERAFQINYTKSSETRVVGYVKETERSAEGSGEDFVIKDNINVLKMANRSGDLGDQEIHTRVIQVLEKYPEISRKLYLYLIMAERINQPDSFLN